MSADYNGWADRPEEEREGEEVAGDGYAAQDLTGQPVLKNELLDPDELLLVRYAA